MMNNKNRALENLLCYTNNGIVNGSVNSQGCKYVNIQGYKCETIKVDFGELLSGSDDLEFSFGVIDEKAVIK